MNADKVLPDLKAWVATLESLKAEVTKERKSLVDAIKKAEAHSYPREKERNNVLRPLKAHLREIEFTLMLIDRGGFLSGEVEDPLGLDFERRCRDKNIQFAGRFGLRKSQDRIDELVDPVAYYKRKQLESFQ